MAPLGWVTPGEATEGVTPIFTWKKTDDFFTHHRLPVLRRHPHPFIFSKKKPTTFFAHHSHFYWFHSGVTPWRVTPCHPAPFSPVRPRFSTVLCKFAHNFFSFGCHPPGGCHPGRSAPHAPFESDSAARSQRGGGVRSAQICTDVRHRYELLLFTVVFVVVSETFPHHVHIGSQRVLRWRDAVWQGMETQSRRRYVVSS